MLNLMPYRQEAGDMGLIFFGLGFGLMIGCGIYFLLIRPALKERREAEVAAKEKQDH